MNGYQLRIGVARFPDGWNVVSEIDGGVRVYDPTFATEAEAEAKARELSAAVREQFDERGLRYEWEHRD